MAALDMPVLQILGRQYGMIAKKKPMTKCGCRCCCRTENSGPVLLLVLVLLLVRHLLLPLLRRLAQQQKLRQRQRWKTCWHAWVSCGAAAWDCSVICQLGVRMQRWFLSHTQCSNQVCAGAAACCVVGEGCGWRKLKQMLR
jgi:hypothetical protein